MNEFGESRDSFDQFPVFLAEKNHRRKPQNGEKSPYSPHETQKLIRILLSQAASDALTATGERAFTIVHRCMRGTEEPETAGRWCIHLAPVEWNKARDAAAVLMGTKRAAAIRKPKPDDTTAGM